MFGLFKTFIGPPFVVWRLRDKVYLLTFNYLVLLSRQQVLIKFKQLPCVFFEHLSFPFARI
jgi:hypothetical protein